MAVDFDDWADCPSYSDSPNNSNSAADNENTGSQRAVRLWNRSWDFRTPPAETNRIAGVKCRPEQPDYPEGI